MNTAKTLTLTARQWETIRCALLCYSIDTRHGWKVREDSDWADEILNAYQLVKDQLEAV